MKPERFVLMKFFHFLWMILLAVCSFYAFGAEGTIPMRVQFTTEGGIAYFPGMSKPVIIDSEKLSEEDAIELRHLVEAAHFFDLPTRGSPPPKGSADFYSYVITVSEKGRQHTIRINEFEKNPELQNLLNFLKAKGEALDEPGSEAH